MVALPQTPYEWRNAQVISRRERAEARALRPNTLADHIRRQAYAVLLPPPIVIRSMADTPHNNSIPNSNLQQPNVPLHPEMANMMPQERLNRLYEMLKEGRVAESGFSLLPYQFEGDFASPNIGANVGQSGPRVMPMPDYGKYMAPGMEKLSPIDRLKEVQHQVHQRKITAGDVSYLQPSQPGHFSTPGFQSDLEKSPFQNDDELQKLFELHQKVQALLDVNVAGAHPVEAASRIAEFNDFIQRAEVHPSFLAKSMDTVNQKNANSGSNRALSDQVVVDRLTQYANQQQPNVPNTQVQHEGDAAHLQQMRDQLDQLVQMAKANTNSAQDNTMSAYDQQIKVWSAKLGVSEGLLRQRVGKLSDESLKIIQGRAQNTSPEDAYQQILATGTPGVGKSQLIKGYMVQLASEGVDLTKALLVSPTKSGTGVLQEAIDDLKDVLGENTTDARTVNSVAWNTLFGTTTIDKDGNVGTPMQLMGKGDVKPSILTDENRQEVFESTDKLHRSMTESRQRYMQKVLELHNIPYDQRQLKDILSGISETKSDRKDYASRMQTGESQFYHGWDTSQPVPHDVAMFVYEQAKFAKDPRFSLKDPELAGHRMDQEDLVVALNAAAQRGHVRQASAFIGDEFQDASVMQAKSLNAVMRGRGPVFLAGDPSQVAVQRRVSMQDFVPEIFKNVRPFQLQQNFRMTRANMALVNAIGADPSLAGSGVAPMAMSMKGIGQTPNYYVEPDLYAMNRKRVTNMFKDMGLTIPEMVNNIRSGKEAFTDATGYRPNEVPAISQTGRTRDMFKQAFIDALMQEGKVPSEAGAKELLKNIYSEHVPDKSDPNLIYNLKISQARSRSFASTHSDVTRTGKWGLQGYLRNLYTMLSRASEQNNIYGARFSFQDEQATYGSQHIPEIIGNTMVPSGFTAINQRAAQNFIAQSGNKKKDLPGFYRQALNADLSQVLNPSLVSADFPLQKFIKTILGLNRYAQPDASSISAMKQLGEGESVIPGQEAQQYVQRGGIDMSGYENETMAMGDGMSVGGQITAATLSGQFARNLVKPLGSLSSYVGQLLSGGIQQGLGGIGSLLTAKGQKGIFPETIEQIVDAAKALNGSFKQEDPEGLAAIHRQAGYDSATYEDMRGKSEFEFDGRDKDDHNIIMSDQSKLQQVMKLFMRSDVAQGIPLVQSQIAKHYSDPRMIGYLQKNSLVSEDWKDQLEKGLSGDFGVSESYKKYLKSVSNSQSDDDPLMRSGAGQDEAHVNFNRNSYLESMVSALVHNSSGNLPSYIRSRGRWLLDDKDVSALTHPDNVNTLIKHLEGMQYPDMADYLRAAAAGDAKDESGIRVSQEYMDNLQKRDPLQHAFLSQMGFAPGVNVEQLQGNGFNTDDPMYTNDGHSGDLATMRMNFMRSLGTVSKDALNELGVPLYMSEMAPVQGQFDVLHNALMKTGVVDPQAGKMVNGQFVSEGLPVSLQTLRSRLEGQEYVAKVSLGDKADIRRTINPTLPMQLGMFSNAHRQFFQPDSDLKQNTQDFFSQHVTQYKDPQLGMLNNIEKMFEPVNQLNYAHAAHIAMLASTGKGIYEGNQYQPENARDFFSNVINGFSDGTRTLENMSGLSTSLGQMSSHIQSTGTLRRSHLMNVLSHLGLPQDAESNRALGILERKHGFTEPSSTVPLRELGTANKVLSLATRAPMLPNTMYTFNGGLHGYPEITETQSKLGLQKGMRGLLLPHTYMYQGKEKTTPFGRPISYRAMGYKNNGLLFQGEDKDSDENAEPLFKFLTQNKKGKNQEFLVRASQLALSDTKGFTARGPMSIPRRIAIAAQRRAPRGRTIAQYLGSVVPIEGVGQVPVSDYQYKQFVEEQEGGKIAYTPPAPAPKPQMNHGAIYHWLSNTFMPKGGTNYNWQRDTFRHQADPTLDRGPYKFFGEYRSDDVTGGLGAQAPNSPIRMPPLLSRNYQQSSFGEIAPGFPGEIGPLDAETAARGKNRYPYMVPDEGIIRDKARLYANETPRAEERERLEENFDHWKTFQDYHPSSPSDFPSSSINEYMSHLGDGQNAQSGLEQLQFPDFSAPFMPAHRYTPNEQIANEHARLVQQVQAKQRETRTVNGQEVKGAINPDYLSGPAWMNDPALWDNRPLPSSREASSNATSPGSLSPTRFHKGEVSPSIEEMEEYLNGIGSNKLDTLLSPSYLSSYEKDLFKGYKPPTPATYSPLQLPISASVPEMPTQDERERFLPAISPLQGEAVGPMDIQGMFSSPLPGIVDSTLSYPPDGTGLLGPGMGPIELGPHIPSRSTFTYTPPETLDPYLLPGGRYHYRQRRRGFLPGLQSEEALAASSSSVYNPLQIPRFSSHEEMMNDEYRRMAHPSQGRAPGEEILPPGLTPIELGAYTPPAPPSPPKSRSQKIQEGLIEGVKRKRGGGWSLVPADADQAGVINSDAQNILVRGGPGGGKTSTVVRSFLRMTHNGVDPERVISLSALNSGANALNRQYYKYQSLLPSPQDHALPKASTFHSLAAKLMFQRGYDEKTGKPIPGYFPALEYIGRGDVKGILADPTAKDLVGKSAGQQARMRYEGLTQTFGRYLKGVYGPGFNIDPDDLKRQLSAIGNLKQDPNYERLLDIAQKQASTMVGLPDSGGARTNVLFSHYQDMLNQSGKIDFTDLMRLGTQGLHELPDSYIPSQIRDAQALVVDEGQDITRNNLGFLGGLLKRMAPGRRSIVGMDVGQSSLEGLGGIHPNDIMDSYRDMYSGMGQSVDEHTLSMNHRATISDTIFGNAILKQDALFDQEKSPLQTPANKELGSFPDLHWGMSQPEINKQMIEKMMSLTGLDFGTARANMNEYERKNGSLKGIQPSHIFQGMKWNKDEQGEDITPGQVPGIFPTNLERQVFEHDLKESIPAGIFGKDERRDVMFNAMYRRGNPNPAEGRDVLNKQSPLQHWGLTYSESRSQEFRNPQIIASRRGIISSRNSKKDKGGWTPPQWLRQFFVASTRPRLGQNSLYATDRYFDQEKADIYMNTNRTPWSPEGHNLETGDTYLTVPPNERNYDDPKDNAIHVHQKGTSKRDDSGAQMVNIGNPDPDHKDAVFVPKYIRDILATHIGDMIKGGYVKPDSTYFPPAIRQHFVPKVMQEQGITHQQVAEAQANLASPPSVGPSASDIAAAGVGASGAMGAISMTPNATPGIDISSGGNATVASGLPGWIKTVASSPPTSARPAAQSAGVQGGSGSPQVGAIADALEKLKAPNVSSQSLASPSQPTSPSMYIPPADAKPPSMPGGPVYHRGPFPLVAKAILNPAGLNPPSEPPPSDLDTQIEEHAKLVKQLRQKDEADRTPESALAYKQAKDKGRTLLDQRQIDQKQMLLDQKNKGNNGIGNTPPSSPSANAGGNGGKIPPVAPAPPAGAEPPSGNQQGTSAKAAGRGPGLPGSWMGTSDLSEVVRGKTPPSITAQTVNIHSASSQPPVINTQQAILQAAAKPDYTNPAYYGAASMSAGGNVGGSQWYVWNAQKAKFEHQVIAQGQDVPDTAIPYDEYVARKRKNAVGPGGSTSATSGPAPDDTSDSVSRLFPNANRQMISDGRLLTHIGSEMNYLGSTMTNYATKAITEGSDYRLATLSLSGSGSDGTSGFFDFANYNGIGSYSANTIGDQQHKYLRPYSQTQIAQGYKNLTTSTNTQFNPLTSQDPLNATMGMAFMAGMDPMQLITQMSMIAGSAGDTKTGTLGNISNLSGMINNLFKGNLSAQNVQPTLDTLQSILPSMQGIQVGSDNWQAPQAMAIFQTALNAGIPSSNLPMVGNTVQSLIGAGTNPDLQQQYYLNKMFPGQLTGGTALAEYNATDTQRKIQSEQLGLMQNIGNGMSLPQLNIKVDQAQISMNQAQLNMSGVSLGQAQASVQGASLNYQYAQASYAFNLNQQNQQYGPIGADRSRTSYYNWLNRQAGASYNALSPEAGTTFKPSQTFGLQNAMFYAGMENQRSQLILQRSPLLADASFQQNMKYIDQQESFYQQQLKLTNEQRQFNVDWQPKLLNQQGLMVTWQQKMVAAQGQVYAQQKVQFDLEKAKIIYDEGMQKIQQKYLIQQSTDLAMIRAAAYANLTGQGPLNGQNISPASLLQAIAGKVNGLSAKDAQPILQSFVAPDQVQTLYQLTQQINSKHLNLNDIANQIGTPGDAKLLAQLQKYLDAGAGNGQQLTATAQDQALHAGGTGAVWWTNSKLVDAFQNSLPQLATELSFTSPIALGLGTIANFIGPLTIAVGEIATIMATRGFQWPGGPGIGGGPGGGGPGVGGGPGGTLGFLGLLAGLGIVLTQWAIPAAQSHPQSGDWWGQIQKGLAKGTSPVASSIADVQDVQAFWGAVQRYGWGAVLSASPAQLQQMMYPDAYGKYNTSKNGTTPSATDNIHTPNKPGVKTPPAKPSYDNGQPMSYPQHGNPAYLPDHLPGNAPETQAQVNQHLSHVTNDQINNRYRDQNGPTGSTWNGTSNGTTISVPSHNNIPTQVYDKGAHDDNNKIITGINTMNATQQKTYIDHLKTLTKVSDGTTSTSNNTATVIPMHQQQLGHLMGIKTQSTNTSTNTKTTASNTGTISQQNKDNAKYFQALGQWVATFTKGGGVSTVGGGAPGGFTTPQVNTQFGAPMWYGKHQGIDFAAAEGTSLRAFNGGKVTGAGWYPWGGEVDVNIAGTPYTERYLHLSALGVFPGQVISKGQLIGLTGGGTPHSGFGYWSRGSHSHVQIDMGNINAGINPWPIWGMSGDSNISQFYGNLGKAGSATHGGARLMAGGGIVTGPTRAMLGGGSVDAMLAEGGSGEAVIPLTKLSETLRSISGASGASTSAMVASGTAGSGKHMLVEKLIGTLNINLNGGSTSISQKDKDTLMQEIIDVIDSVLVQVTSKN